MRILSTFSRIAIGIVLLCLLAACSTLPEEAIIPPTIKSFIITPSTITVGESATISWEIEGTGYINISIPKLFTEYGRSDLNNNMVISPVVTTTYEIVVSGEDDYEVKKEITVNVEPKTVVVTPTNPTTPANPTNSKYGESAMHCVQNWVDDNDPFWSGMSDPRRVVYWRNICSYKIEWKNCRHTQATNEVYWGCGSKTLEAGEEIDRAIRFRFKYTWAACEYPYVPYGHPTASGNSDAAELYPDVNFWCR